VRFELTYKALDPTLTIVSPWKDPRFLADGLTDRETAIEYAERHGIPITQTKKKIYSQDRNLWHISHEGAEIEDPAREPLDQVYTITVPVAKAPAKAEYVEIAFERGVPTAVNGKKYRNAGHDLVYALNRLGGKHAVGQVTLVENRLVGMKSRGVYETPGGTILYEAHKALEQLCLERDLYHYKQQAALKYGELVYYGQWFHPLREALQTFMDHANQVVTGTVKVKLYKGRGCANCNNTGYRGRVGLFEVMEITDEIRELVLSGASALELKRKAIEEGMISLRQSGIFKLREGHTTVEEILRETVL